MDTPAGRALAIRRFSDEDQLRFAELSGDTNPLHVDPIAARRTLMGKPVVHGVHLIMLSLDAIFGVLQEAIALASIRARFPSPVLVGDEIELRVAEADGPRWRIAGYVENDLVLDLTVLFGQKSGDDDAAVPGLEPASLHDLRFSELSEAAGSLSVGIEPALARRLFARLAADLGLPVFAELLALTRLVGMRCPGRHSILSQIDVTFDRTDVLGELRFEVCGVDERFLRITMAVAGARLRGKLTAFFRPPPQPQPRMAELRKVLRGDEFRNSVALVVGGSRGLGEITAKLLAAGGARATITYHRGERDAVEVAADIRSSGGYCECAQLNVLDPGPALREIFATAASPLTVYYFATPHIFARRRRFFSPELLQRFIDYYVIGLSKLIDAVDNEKNTKLRVFFPSTNAIDENLREIAEYSMAKRLGEDLCAFYNRYSKNIALISERLPRTRTDQTATLAGVPAEDGVNVMLPIVRRIELVGINFGDFNKLNWQ
jgi:hypothetical protein